MIRLRYTFFTFTVIGVGLLLIACGSDKTIVTSPPDLTPPATPRGVYSVTGDQAVTINWLGSDEPDLAGYVVYRSDESAGPYNEIGEITATGQQLKLSFVDYDVINGRTYYYAVSSFDDAGNLSELSYDEVFDTPRPAGVDVRLYARERRLSLAGFDFSRHVRVSGNDPDADIVITMNGDVLYIVAADLQTDVQDFGYTESLDDLDWAPPDGWSSVGDAELIVGHTYAIWTRDDHYAKIRVTQSFPTSVLVDWAYQIDPGNPELKPGRPAADSSAGL